jgi:hypothetical protein
MKYNTLKIVFFSVASTTVAISLVFYLFMNGILGIFGLAATKVEALVALNGAQQVLQKVRKRHIKKRIKYKGILKGRITKKLLPMLPVIGAGFVVYDYCLDEKELQIDEDILNGTQTEFGMEECKQRGKENITHELYELKEKLKSLKNQSVDGTREGWSKTKKWIDKMRKEIKNDSQNFRQKIKDHFSQLEEKGDGHPPEDVEGGRLVSKEMDVMERLSIKEEMLTIMRKIKGSFGLQEKKSDDTFPEKVEDKR